MDDGEKRKDNVIQSLRCLNLQTVKGEMIRADPFSVYWEHTWAVDVQLPRAALNGLICNEQWCRGEMGQTGLSTQMSDFYLKNLCWIKEYFFLDCLSPQPNLFSIINSHCKNPTFFYDESNIVSMLSYQQSSTDYSHLSF